MNRCRPAGAYGSPRGCRAYGSPALGVGRAYGELMPDQPALPDDTGYDDSGVPTFESVREKIEARYGTAVGAAELDAESPEGRAVEEQYEARRRTAAERLAQIRQSMHSDDS